MADSNLYTIVMSTLDPSHATVSVHESDGVAMQSVQKYAASPPGIGPGPYGRFSAFFVAVITANSTGTHLQTGADSPLVPVWLVGLK